VKNEKNIKNLKHFTPGTSGNPSGRPKGVKNRSTIVLKWLKARMEVTDPIKKTKIKGSVEDQIVLAIITKAMKGDVSAFKELMDSGYGKANQQVDVTSLGEKLPSVPPNILIVEDNTEQE